MTQGALGHTGAQGRARGFWKIAKKYPKVEVVDTTAADWDVSRVASIWEKLLTKFPKLDAAYFHNDDMALAAYDVMKAHNRTSIKIGGCDAMPPALQAVTDGRMVATVRNPPCLIHGGALTTVSGEKTDMGPGMIPKHVVTDGPVVTKANAPGLAWMEEHFLI
jgi:ribose transport system substrate-binding protein